MLAAAMLTCAGAPTACADTVGADLKVCLDCHDASTHKQDPSIPALGGQPELFIMYQLHFFRSGQRENQDMNGIMADKSDDDLRALARYVTALPAPKPEQAGIDEARYRRGAALAAKHRCTACHNADYSGRDQMPRLAGQREIYLRKVLKDFRSGARIGTQAAMAGIVRNLSDADWADLAHFFAHFKD